MTEDYYKLDLPYMLVTFMGQLQAAPHTVLTLPALTPGLRLMVLLLSGEHWSLWEKEEKSSEESLIPATEGSSLK